MSTATAQLATEPPQPADSGIVINSVTMQSSGMVRVNATFSDGTNTFPYVRDYNGQVTLDAIKAELQFQHDLAFAAVDLAASIPTGSIDTTPSSEQQAKLSSPPSAREQFFAAYQKLKVMKNLDSLGIKDSSIDVAGQLAIVQQLYDPAYLSEPSMRY